LRVKMQTAKQKRQIFAFATKSVSSSFFSENQAGNEPSI
jgi:hypothetical protein